MCDEDAGDALFMELVDDFHDLFTAFGVKHGCRFVKNNALRPHRDRACNGDPLFLTAGKQMRCILFKGRHPDRFQRVIDTLSDLGRCDTQILRPKSNIILDDRGNDLVVRILEDHAGGLTDVPEVFFILRIVAVDEDRSFCRQKQRVDQLCQRRFAGTVLSDDRDKTALFNRQGKIAKRSEGFALFSCRICKCHMIHTDEVFHQSLLPFRPS